MQREIRILNFVSSAVSNLTQHSWTSHRTFKLSQVAYLQVAHAIRHRLDKSNHFTKSRKSRAPKFGAQLDPIFGYSCSTKQAKTLISGSSFVCLFIYLFMIIRLLCIAVGLGFE